MFFGLNFTLCLFCHCNSSYLVDMISRLKRKSVMSGASRRFRWFQVCLRLLHEIFSFDRCIRAHSWTTLQTHRRCYQATLTLQSTQTIRMIYIRTRKTFVNYSPLRHITFFVLVIHPPTHVHSFSRPTDPPSLIQQSYSALSQVGNSFSGSTIGFETQILIKFPLETLSIQCVDSLSNQIVHQMKEKEKQGEYR